MRLDKTGEASTTACSRMAAHSCGRRPGFPGSIVAEYAQPETLVSSAWVAEHQNDPSVRVEEVDVDTSANNEGHVPERLPGPGPRSFAIPCGAIFFRNRISKG